MKIIIIIIIMKKKICIAERMGYCPDYIVRKKKNLYCNMSRVLQ